MHCVLCKHKIRTTQNYKVIQFAHGCACQKEAMVLFVASLLNTQLYTRTHTHRHRHTHTHTCFSYLMIDDRVKNVSTLVNMAMIEWKVYPRW